MIQLAGFGLFISSAGLANAQTVKVACVGDSITALPSSWCGTLSTKLGSGYMVSNFGVSGTNLAKNVAQPYWDSAQYTPSHTFAPNIVIIMLGTNDAFTRSWSSAKGHFVKDYEELIDTYTSLASKPKPYMIIPTPIGTSPFGHDGNLLATEVIPLVKQVAMNKMVPTIDGFTLFGGAMFDTGLYSASDQVHPNAKGQQMLGEEVYKVLMSTGALGGSSSAGTGAMAAGSGARAGSGGMAAPAPTNASAGAAALPMAGTGAAPVGSAVGMNTASAGNAASSGNPTTPTTAGPTPTTPASTSSTGAANSRTPVGNTASSTSAVGAAGAPTPPTAPVSRSEDSGCQTTGAAKGNGAATAALVLALCMIGNRRKRRA